MLLGEFGRCDIRVFVRLGGTVQARILRCAQDDTAALLGRFKWRLPHPREDLTIVRSLSSPEAHSEVCASGTAELLCWGL